MKQLRSLLFFKLMILCLVIIKFLSPAIANDVDNRLGSKLINADFVHGEFLQKKYIKVLSLPLVSTGNFTYKKTQGLVWETLVPMESKFVISSSQPLTGSDRNNLKNESSSKLLAEIFLSFFSGDVYALERVFHIDDKTSIGNNLLNIELTPISSQLKKYIANIEVGGNEHVETIKINEVSGDRTEINLKVLELN